MGPTLLDWKFATTARVAGALLGVCLLGLSVDAAAAGAAAAPGKGSASEGPAPADGQPSDEAGRKAQARVHFERGIQAFRAGRYKDAIDAFLDANRVYPSPALSYNTARAYERLGDWAGALRFYRDYLRRDPDASDKAKVAERIGELEQKLRQRGVQQVTVLSEPDAATVVIDGRPVGVTPWTGEIFPGTHRVELRRDGYERAEGEFELLPHRAMDVSMKLQKTPEAAPAAPEPPPPPATAAPEAAPAADTGPQETGGPAIKPWTWAALGGGVAALGGALAFDRLSAGSEDDARKAATQIEAASAVDSMQSQQTAARVLVGVGGALVLAGGALLFVDLKSNEKDEPETGQLRLGGSCTPAGCHIVTRGTF